MKTSIKKLLSPQLGAGAPIIIIIMNPLISYEELADPESRIAQETVVNPAALTSRVQKSVSAGIKYSGIAHTGTCSN